MLLMEKVFFMMVMLLNKYYFSKEIPDLVCRKFYLDIPRQCVPFLLKIPKRGILKTIEDRNEKLVAKIFMKKANQTFVEFSD